MEWNQSETDHQYQVEPVFYKISDNNRPATYDQFILLRDTLIQSNKYYGDKAGRSLIIGTKLDGTPTNTIEVWEPNIMRMDFQPGGTITPYVTGQYVSTGGHSGLSCEILKKGRYKIQHKEQFNNISSSITRIHTYVLQHTGNDTIKRAEFDWERNTGGEMIRMTAYGYVECDLDKGDRLELIAEDQNGDSIISDMTYDSNWFMVEYIDLAYKI